MQNKKGRIIAVCSAPQKGMIKHEIGEGRLIEGIGLEGDAHAGFMHRQVSLISMEDIRTMMAKLPNLVPPQAPPQAVQLPGNESPSGSFPSRRR